MTVQKRKERVYFVPGTLCDERMWSLLWPHLPPQFDYQHLVIPEGGDINTIAAKLLKQITSPHFKLVGFSLGGYLASLMALQQPDRIDKLFIIGNAPCPLPSKDKMARAKVLKLLTKFGYGGISLKKIFDLIHTEQQQNLQVIDLIKEMDNDMGGNVLIKQLTMTTEREDISAALSQLSAPISFCYGDQDKLVNRALIKVLAKQVPNIRQNEVNGAGHMLPLEQPEQLAQYLTQWLLATDF